MALIIHHWFGAFGFSQFIDSLNDQSGALTVSTGTLPADTFINELAFEGVAITPDSIIADVRSAIASGAISNGGVGNALLAELGQAADARSRGQCAAAARIYQSFVQTVNAQRGKTIAAATASQLVSEATFLMGNCP